MNGKIVGGHALFASAYDDKGLWVENSWGTGWGHNGYGELSWNLINSDVLEIGTLLPGMAGRNPIPAPAGAQIATAARNGNQEDAFFVGGDGALYTTYEVNDGAWSAPIALTAAHAAPAGAPVAAAVRNDHQEDVFYAGSDGKLYTLFEANDGPWSAPTALSASLTSSINATSLKLGGQPGVRKTISIVSPGAHIATAVRNDHQEDIFFIGTDGKLYTLFEVNDGAWSSASALTATSAAPSGASIASAVRNDHQEDVFYVGSAGVLYTTFEANDGPWATPIALTRVPTGSFNSTLSKLGGHATGSVLGVVPAGADVAAVVRNDHQEDVFFVGATGKLYTTYEDNDGAWATPIALTADNAIPSAGNIEAVVRNDHQEDLFYLDVYGALNTMFEAQDGPWSAPIPLSAGGFAPKGAPVAAVVRNDHQEDIFLAGADGTLATADEVQDGPWVLISPLLGFS